MRTKTIGRTTLTLTTDGRSLTRDTGHKTFRCEVGESLALRPEALAKATAMNWATSPVTILRFDLDAAHVWVRRKGRKDKPMEISSLCHGYLVRVEAKPKRKTAAPESEVREPSEGQVTAAAHHSPAAIYSLIVRFRDEMRKNHREMMMAIDRLAHPRPGPVPRFAPANESPCDCFGPHISSCQYAEPLENKAVNGHG